MSSSEDDYPQVQIDPADLSDSSLDDPSPQETIVKKKCKDVVKQDVTKPKKERTPKQRAAWERCLAANRKKREEAKKIKEEKSKPPPTPEPESESESEPEPEPKPKKEKKKKKKVRPPTPEPSESESSESEEEIVLPKRKTKKKSSTAPTLRFV